MMVGIRIAAEQQGMRFCLNCHTPPPVGRPRQRLYLPKSAVVWPPLSASRIASLMSASRRRSGRMNDGMGRRPDLTASSSLHGFPPKQTFTSTARSVSLYPQVYAPSPTSAATSITGPQDLDTVARMTKKAPPRRKGQPRTSHAATLTRSPELPAFTAHPAATASS